MNKRQKKKFQRKSHYKKYKILRYFILNLEEGEINEIYVRNDGKGKIRKAVKYTGCYPIISPKKEEEPVTINFNCNTDYQTKPLVQRHASSLLNMYIKWYASGMNPNVDMKKLYEKFKKDVESTKDKDFHFSKYSDHISQTISFKTDVTEEEDSKIMRNVSKYEIPSTREFPPISRGQEATLELPNWLKN